MRNLVIFSAAMLAATQSSAGLPEPQFELTPIGTYASGIFAEGSAEIVAFDPATKRAFVVNAVAATVDVLDFRNPAAPSKQTSIDVTLAADSLGAANSVDVQGGILAVAIERDPKQSNGIVAFYDTKSLALLGTADVGALPDMLAFTPNGDYVVVANEGEPDDAYVTDPEGTISIIDMRKGVARLSVRTADFRSYNSRKAELVGSGVRVFGPGATVAQDFEPEYVAFEGDGSKAYVSLQENNALAVVDIRKAVVTDILPLGSKDHSLAGNGLDASDRDGGINIQTWPLRGLYLPDSIASYTRGKNTYIVTANEGDSRDYDGFSEEVRIKDIDDDLGKSLDPTVFPNAADLVKDAQLGRLKVTSTLGDANNDGMFEALYSFGARSFSIWDTAGKLVWDSGDEFEAITANLIPAAFNSNHEENNSFDSRSDDKGPEPEAVAVGNLLGRTYAFIGLERVGGVMMYDITNPRAPFFVTYANNRDFTVANPEDAAAGDLGPEHIEYVPWFRSPNWRPLLIVSNEVSGTTTVYQIDLKLWQ